MNLIELYALEQKLIHSEEAMGAVPPEVPDDEVIDWIATNYAPVVEIAARIKIAEQERDEPSN